jgi:hypothetical protein
MNSLRQDSKLLKLIANDVFTDRSHSEFDHFKSHRSSVQTNNKRASRGIYLEYTKKEFYHKLDSKSVVFFFTSTFGESRNFSLTQSLRNRNESKSKKKFKAQFYFCFYRII